MKSWAIVGILLVLLGSAVNASTILVSSDPVALAIEAGNHYAKKGEHALAIKWFDEAIKLDPFSAAAHHNKGVVQHELGQTSDAIKSFQNAIDANPTYAKAHYSLALEHYSQGNREESLKELHAVVEFEPYNAHAHFDLGVIYVEQFREVEDAGVVTAKDLDVLNRALSHYENVVAIDPKFPYAEENADIIKNVLNSYMQ